ncbi:MAG TPA: DUF4194 domain-containing protein [Clostridiales bacterium]|nr:DUF4194 domain-containing protein [Clostridiales bacterium]
MEIFNESIVQKEKFRNAANKLLNNCFIVKRKEDTRNDYIFILQYRTYFEEYFDLLGYQLKINENSDVIGLINYNGTGRLRLKKIESIILLIIRLLYIEKRNELGLIDDVIILSESIHEKYSMLKIDSKMNIDKTSLKEAFRIFKRYNLVSPIDSDITKADARIIVYPSVLFAVSSDNINDLYDRTNKKLDSYFNGGETTYDEEIDED